MRDWRRSFLFRLRLGGPLIRTAYKQQDWTKKVLKAKYAAYFRSSVCQESQALIPNWSVSLKTFDSGQVNYFFFSN